MSKINITADLLAKLKHFSDGGDVIAEALYLTLENEYVVALSAAAKVGNVITITGTITKLDGTKVTSAVNVMAESYPAVGAGTMALNGANGTAKAGAASKSLWIQSLATGVFAIDVTDLTVGDPCLVRITLDNGITEAIQLTF